jgi:hypothetical protein
MNVRPGNNPTRVLGPTGRNVRPGSPLQLKGTPTWTPSGVPTPEPLPPAPLLDLRMLGLIALQGIAWLIANSTRGGGGKGHKWTVSDERLTMLPLVGDYVVTFEVVTKTTLWVCSTDAILSEGTSSNLVKVSMANATGFQLDAGSAHDLQVECGKGLSTFTPPSEVRWQVLGGSITGALLAGGTSLGHGPDMRSRYTRTVNVVSVTRNGAEVSAPPAEFDGEVVPLPEEEVQPVKPPPVVPVLPAVPLPVPVPEVNPEFKPAPVPGLVPLPSPAPRPVKIPGRIDTDNGVLVKPRPRPIPTTPPGWTIPWPGAAPIPDVGVGPRPDLIGIATEVGKIERKIEWMNGGGGRPVFDGDGPLDLFQIASKLLEFLTAMNAETTYRLTGPCETDASGAPLPAVEIDVAGSDSALGVIRNRVDAIAALLQVHKDLKQPICKPERPKPTGQWVTVNFLSDAPSPGGNKQLRKRLRYLDQSGTEQLAHTIHWEDFEWQAGPVCVISKNLAWGVPQVWAASEAEGKRVIGHAAAIAGVDLADPAHEWVITRSVDARYGQMGMMRTERRNTGLIRVSKRDGPSGLPGLYGAAPDP